MYADRPRLGWFGSVRSKSVSTRVPLRVVLTLLATSTGLAASGFALDRGSFFFWHDCLCVSTVTVNVSEVNATRCATRDENNVSRGECDSEKHCEAAQCTAKASSDKE